MLRILILCVAWMGCCVGALAHEIRPAYLEIKEAPAGELHIAWKQPVVGEVALPIRPLLSSGWLDPQAASSTYNETYLIRRWVIREPLAALEGQRLTIEGLRSTLTDTLVRIQPREGAEHMQMIKPDAPDWTVPALSKATPSVPGYLLLGIEHIWTGIDHLLFVLGLMLLATRFRELLKTITAFTIEHSVTLAAAAFGWIHVPPAPVEAVIALSILFLAVELATHRHTAHASIAQRFPWLIALLFGLLHGFGFAGALSEVGLPEQSIPLALLSFNVGIELGQIVFVAAVLIVLRLLALRLPRVVPQIRWAMPQLIGSLAAFWFIERTVTALTY